MAIAPRRVGTQFVQEADARAGGEPGREVARARPIELRGEAATVSVGDGERMKDGLRVPPRPQEAAAARGEEPFMTVARVPVGAQRRQVELELTGGVREIGRA